MDNTVTDGVDFAHRFYAAIFGICQHLYDDTHGVCMVFHGHAVFIACALDQVAVIYNRAVSSDSLTDTFRDSSLSRNIEQLILQGTASRIDNKNVH
jgi:hypothetical protein